MKALLLLIALSNYPAWMAGSWRAGNVEEHWTAADGRMMIGMSKTAGEKKTAFEFLRIAEVDGKLAYIAMPQGGTATVFPLKSSEASKVVFENLKHDFPQRILYWRDGEKLCARVEAADSAQGEQWCYAPIH
ncbi:MAG TPA: DUF6265 family protein [Thermoanaerobaculia bacterium]|nr:DUF6265 family protein [Thermoanaerobaculia bacterium]